MNIFEEIKLAIKIRQIYKEVMKVDKIKGLLGKLDGLKSLLGLLGVVGYFGAKAYGVAVPEVVLTTSYGLLGVGLVHKLEKATGILGKIIPVLGSILDVLNKKKEETK